MNEIKQIGIFGSSGMARETGDIAWALGFTPVFIARDQEELDLCSFSSNVTLERNLSANIPYVIGVGDARIRKDISDHYKYDLKFVNLIHPSATFGYNQREKIDKSIGIIIAAGVRITSGIEIGDFCIINQNVTIAHDSVLGSYIHLASGVHVSGNVHINDGCSIGAGAVINQGSCSKKIEIGKNTVVGSGAVVIDDCEPNAVYVGLPAKRLK